MKYIDIYIEDETDPGYKIIFLYHLIFFFSMNDGEIGDFEKCYDYYKMKSELEDFIEDSFTFDNDYDNQDDFTRIRCLSINTYLASEKYKKIEAVDGISLSKKFVEFLEQEKIEWDINQKRDRMNPFIKITAQNLELSFSQDMDLYINKWPKQNDFQDVFSCEYFFYSPDANFSSYGNSNDLIESISTEFWNKGICPTYTSIKIIEINDDEDMQYCIEKQLTDPISIESDIKEFNVDTYNYDKDVSRINLEGIFQKLYKEYESQYHDEITPNYNDSKEKLDLLFNAVKADDLECVKTIMKDISNINSNYGFEPFIFSVIGFISVEILELFIENDLDLDDWDSANVDLYNRIQWDASDKIKDFIEPLFE